MPENQPVETNRNGVIGDFDAYMPVRRSMEELIKAAIRNRHREQAVSTERVSSTILRLDESVLVRYRFGTDELWDDSKAVKSVFSDHDREMAEISALFGIIRDDGVPLATFHVICEPKPLLHYVSRNPDVPCDKEMVLQVLRHLDVPAAPGTDNQVAKVFDLWRDDETGEWEIREPIMAVRVTLERTCFITSPALEEKLDVLVAINPAFDLASPDESDVYWAKSHYRDMAFGRLQDLPGAGVRPGFSSWMSRDPVLLKVIGTGLESELAAIAAPEDAEPIDEIHASPGFGR